MNQSQDEPRGEKGSNTDRSMSSYLLSFLTGVAIFAAVSLLCHPDLDEVQAAWATFYGDF